MQASSSQSSQAADPEGASASSEFDEFVYLISHDVRASVRALQELPQWLVEDLAETGVTLDAQNQQTISLMQKHTSRLDRMLLDLLTYSRIGRMQEVARQHIPAALATALAEVALPPSFELTETIEHETLQIGERDIATLLVGIIGNAPKHHDKDAGKIDRRVFHETGQVVLWISDDGPGIDPQYHERVFGAMTTLRPRDEVEGSGMGLAQARKIAEFYGGSIAIRPSVFERGTCIELRFPG